MLLYRYFQPVAKSLPDLNGPLSSVMPLSTIKAANDAVLATQYCCAVLDFASRYIFGMIIAFNLRYRY